MHAVLQKQIDMVNDALNPVMADGTVVGMGLWEMTPSRGPESDSDHAAKWETSNMMVFCPDLVDLSEPGTGPLAPNIKPPDGVVRLDPREHASAAVGQRNVELVAAPIGRKARELLESLPKEHQSFGLNGIEPEHWWMV